MRIVITGAAGFIGSQTAHLLLSSGHDVIGIDSMTNYYDPLIKVARSTRPNIEFFISET